MIQAEASEGSSPDAAAEAPATPPEEGGAGGGEGARDAADASADLGALAGLLLEEGEEVLGHLRVLANVEADRARLFVRESALGIALILAAALALAALLVTALVLLSDGLSGALSELLGGPQWRGRLAAGGLMLALVAGAGLLWKRVWSRRLLRRSEAKYDELERKHVARSGGRVPPTPTEEHARAAGSARAAGTEGAAPVRPEDAG